MTRSVLLLALGLLVGACGVSGPKGNDTGGIIPWTPENEARALVIANDNCGWYDKYAVVTSVRRVPGDYIAYQCRRRG